MRNLLAWELPFNETELKLILIALGVFVVLVVANVLLVYFYKRHQKRKMCTNQLDKRREELLKELSSVRSNVVVDTSEEITPNSEFNFTAFDQFEKTAEPVQSVVTEVVKADEAVVETAPVILESNEVLSEETEEPDVDEVDDVDDIDDDMEISDSETPTDAPLAVDENYGTIVIPVRQMTRLMRKRLDLLEEKHDNLSYLAQCRYSFEAKLRSSDDVVKARYQKLCEELALYKGVKIRRSFKQERIYIGRKTLGLIMFRGKTLCIAFALNPADYAATKYRGIDKSDKKRFAKTPMLFRLTSERKVQYARYLLLQLADKFTIVMDPNPMRVIVNAITLPLAELYERDLVHIQLLSVVEGAEVPEETAEAPAEEAEAVVEEVVEEADTDEDEVADFLDDEDDSQSVSPENGISVGTMVISVAEMTRLMRKRLDILDEEYDDKKFYAQCRYSFEAKLRSSDNFNKQNYQLLMNDIARYKNVKVKRSFKQERVYFGRKTMALVLFRGKTLCVAFALNPKDFAETKYHGIDKSDKKRFEKTPMLMRITSGRKLNYVMYLFSVLAGQMHIGLNKDVEPVFINSVFLPLAELYERDLVHITLLGEATDEEPKDVEISKEDSVEFVASTEVHPDQSVIEELVDEPLFEKTEPLEAIEEVEESVEEPAEEPVEEVEEKTEEAVEDTATEAPTEVATVAADTSEGDSDDDEDGPVGENGIGSYVLSVSEMTPFMRKRLKLEGEEHQNEKYYGQYRFGFEAKLRVAGSDVKAAYKMLREEMARYDGLRIRRSFKMERIYFGKLTLGQLLFNGKTLCFALALDPKEFADTKYRGLDKTGKKRFEETPMLFKITSERRAGFAVDLMAHLAKVYGVKPAENPQPVDTEADYMELSEMYEKGLVRLTLFGLAD